MKFKYRKQFLTCYNAIYKVPYKIIIIIIIILSIDY